MKYYDGKSEVYGSELFYRYQTMADRKMRTIEFEVMDELSDLLLNSACDFVSTILPWVQYGSFEDVASDYGRRLRDDLQVVKALDAFARPLGFRCGFITLEKNQPKYWDDGRYIYAVRFNLIALSRKHDTSMWAGVWMACMFGKMITIGSSYLTAANGEQI